ncbi:hypothetical protein G7059_05380 [Erysipelothrix sp. HDW6A]|uniref:hypothetical protein n=1 Tax=Erysipelothrix sp. HDW6A TaxID=2714928 RepID=UPI00140CB886|nr:hypothetical protein [Erysipelothrix sp. HDW6A]QIK57312.1 hypothetical protein G7059_05380 [Erysipelothrix sp. HDW6A]
MIQTYITNNKKKAVLYFMMFLALNIIVDNLNITYSMLADRYYILIPVASITMSVIMATLSAYLIMVSSMQYDLIGKETKGGNLSFISIVFGILTYGCTPCVISFFAAIGVSFSVYALPFDGLPYKFLSIALLLLGIWFTHREINKTCAIKA